MTVAWEKLAYAKNLPALPYVVGDLIYANSTSTLAKLADVALGSVLMSGGVGAAPGWQTDIALAAGGGRSVYVRNGGNDDLFVHAGGSSLGGTIGGRLYLSGGAGGTGVMGEIILALGGRNVIIAGSFGAINCGAGAYGALGIGSGDAPADSPADMAQLWVDDIGGTAGKAGFHIRNEDGGTGPILYGAGVDAWTTAQDPGHKHSALWASDGSPQAVWVDAAGYVGIGKAIPTALLHLYGDVNNQVSCQFENPNAGSAASALLDFRNNVLGADDRVLVGLTGTGYTNVPSWQNAGLFAAMGNVTGGLVFAAISGPIKFETGGYGGAYQRMIIDTGGNVGIGTTSPGQLFVVDDYSNTKDYQLRLSAIAQAYYYDIGRNHSTGLLNFYGSQSGANGYVFGGVDRTMMTILNSGVIVMPHYGAGTATFDASGNISSVSDERLKIILGKYTGGIAQLMGIEPIVHKWNELSGMEMDHEYVGFSAQNVQENMPEAVYENKDGYLSYSDKAIIAALVNCVKTQQAQIEAMQAR